MTLRKRIDRWLASRPDDPAKEKRAESVFLILLFASVFIVVVVFVSGLWLDLYSPEFWRDGGTTTERQLTTSRKIVERRAPNAEVVRNVLFAFAGLVGGVFGLYQLHSSAKRTRFGAMDAQTRREAERNDRFVKAAELLKDEDASVRMAGVFALERLALEPGAEYAATVLDVLAGFVRDRTTRPDYPPRPNRACSPDRQSDDAPEEEDREEDEARAEAGGWGQPTEPVKAAVTALNKVWREQTEHFKQRNPIDLRNVDLARLETFVFDFSFWRLDRANLQRARLYGVNLQGAQLSGANLQGAQLNSANLQDAWLFSANLQDAQLVGANLGGATLDGANLQGARLDSANLQFAQLFSANLQDAQLDSANLQFAQLFSANLQDAQLVGANLQGARLVSAGNLQTDQLQPAVWPTGAPPTLPDSLDPASFDKSEFTNPDDPTTLKPELVDKAGRYSGPSKRFSQREI